MSEIPEVLLVHRAAVQTLLGHNAYGEDYEATVEFPCFISHRRRFARASDGTETAGVDATLRAPLALDGVITEESEIVLHTERAAPLTGTVVAVSPNTDGGLGAWQHLKVEVSR